MPEEENIKGVVTHMLSVSGKLPKGLADYNLERETFRIKSPWCNIVISVILIACSINFMHSVWNNDQTLDIFQSKFMACPNVLYFVLAGHNMSNQNTLG